MRDFKKIKNAICFSVINRKTNEEVLKELPHIEVLDLAILFYYKRDKGFEKGAISIIRNEDVKRWGIALEELHQVATENTQRLLPSIFQTIEKVMEKIAKEENLPSPCDEEPRERMYVLTNEEKYLGAGTILYPSVLQKIYKRLGVGFFVIPSSTHEVIIMQDTGSVTAENLQSLVVDMNKHFLDAEEVLSDNIYRYDIEKGELVIT